MLHKASKCQLDLCCAVARAYHTMLYFFEMLDLENMHLHRFLAFHIEQTPFISENGG